jgi:CRP/FNR family cyclic AMP-dependent transcriptional regulator
MQAAKDRATNDWLRKVIVFRYLTDDALREMSTICEITNYTEGERIVSEGELDDHLYAVLQGGVNVFVRDTAQPAKEVFICAIGEGDVFGEAGIFLQTPRTANVTAAVACTVLRISREKLFAFIQRYPSGGMRILYIIIYSLLKKLRDANQEIAFERKSVLRQEDIDSVVEEALKKI